MRAGGFSPESVPSSKQSKTILKHQREPRASTYRAGLAHDRRPKNRPRRPVEVRARRSEVPSLRPLLRAPSGETQKPGGRCSRQNSNRHSCNDRSARALRPSPPDAARTTSSAAKTAANQSESREKMAGIAEGRLREERRSWRKDHPIGFVARPRSKADGSTDLLNWDARPRRFNPRRRVASMAWMSVVLSHPHAVAAIPPHAGRHPGQEGHDVGRLRVQPHDGVQQRLPRDPRCLNQIVAARLRHVRTRLAD